MAAKPVANDNARPFVTSPWWRRTVAVVAALVAIMAVSGCSVMPGGSSDPSDVDLGDARLNSSDVTVALAATRERSVAEPAEPYWPYRMGELYLRADSLSRAAYQMQLTLEVDPSYAPAASLLSKIYYDAGMHEEGIAVLDGFIANNPNAPDAVRAALALHLEALGDVETANSVLDGCSPNSEVVRATRTFVTLRGLDPTSALDLARESVEQNSKSAANHNNYGIALLCAGKPEEARKAFLKALDINEQLPGALYNMAIVEAFYFFNEDAGRNWFARYKKVASDDPDNLASVLGNDSTALLNGGKD